MTSNEWEDYQRQKMEDYPGGKVIPTMQPTYLTPQEIKERSDERKGALVTVGLLVYSLYRIFTS